VLVPESKLLLYEASPKAPQHKKSHSADQYWFRVQALVTEQPSETGIALIAVSTSACDTLEAASDGCFVSRRATAPATWGVAIEVPERVAELDVEPG